MKPSLTEAATRISRALITTAHAESNTARPWTRHLEQTLYALGLRDTLTPSLVAQVIDPHLLYHPSLSLGFFHWASQQTNFSHSSLSYHSLLKSLSLSRQFSPLMKAFKEAKTRKFDVDLMIYRCVIGYLIKCKRTHEAFLVFKEVISLIDEIGDGVCNSLLAGLVSEGHFDCADKVFNEMLERGVRFSTLGFGVFIWVYCKNAELGKVLGVLDEVRKGGSPINGSIVALLIVHGLCRAQRVGDAFSMLVELRSRDCKPDFMAYRIVAEGFRSMGYAAEVQMVLKKKRKLGVAPRTSDYRDILFALISEKLIYEAKELGEVIVNGNFPIEDDVLNALIGSVSVVDPCSAMSFFKFMLGKERMPNLLTLKNLSRNLCKHEKTGELLEVFDILSSKEYFTDLESYNVMVSFLCMAGRVREAYAVLQDMRRKGLGPNISSYNILMEALCSADLVRPAKKLWDEMFAGGMDGNLTTYNILIKKFVETSQLDEAHILFNHMLEKGVMPDTTTYTSLLECLCQDSRIEAAIGTFHKACDQDTALAQSILTPFVLYLCNGGHFLTVSRFLCSLSWDLKPSESHVVFLKCLADGRQNQIAIDHIKQVMDNSSSLMQDILTELSALLSSAPNLEPILQLLRQMQQNIFISKNDAWRDFCGKLLLW